MYRHLLVYLSICSFALGAAAQRRAPDVNLNVRISFVNEQPGNAQYRVQLLQARGTPMMEAQTDSRGQVDFLIAPGTYVLRVTGVDIEDTLTGQFTIGMGDVSHTEFVQVRPRQSANVNGAGPSGGATVSAAELNISKKEREEFEKGNKDIKDQKWDSARKHFEKVLAEAPKFAGAQNNLGVACARLRERAGKEQAQQYDECARQAFQQAVTLDPKLTTAYLNLARIEMKTHNFAQVQALLQKYLASSPEDPEALTMLSEAELVSGNYDSALADAEKVNALPQHDNFAIAHYVAGRALEAKQRAPEAAAEYQTFLKAQPNSPQAPMARAALSRLHRPNP